MGFKVGDRIRVYFVDGAHNTGVITFFSERLLKYQRDICGNTYSAHPKQCRRLVKKGKCPGEFEKYTPYDIADPIFAKCKKCGIKLIDHYPLPDKRKDPSYPKIGIEKDIVALSMRIDVLVRRIQDLEKYRGGYTCSKCEGTVSVEMAFRRCDCDAN